MRNAWLISIVAGWLALSAQAMPLDKWHLRNPRFTPDNLSAVAYGNGLYVAVGWTGNLLTSPDGVEWTKKELGTTNNLLGVNYLNGIFVVTGGTAEQGSVIFTSTDGLSWTEQKTPLSDPIVSVTYGKGKFVAVGGGYFAPASESYLSSVDGTNWLGQKVSGGYLAEVLFAEDHFFAVSSRGVLESEDGETWNIIYSEASPSGLAYGNGALVAVGSPILTSFDRGVSWIASDPGTTEPLYHVTFNHGIFVAVGYKTILTSSNGTNWVARLTGSSDLLEGATYGDGHFIAVGRNGAMLTSPDAMDWVNVAGDRTDLKDITIGNDTFVAVGSGGILTSTNGTIWNRQPSPSLEGVAYGNGLFVAVGHKLLENPDPLTGGGAAVILASTNGSSWAERSLEVNLPLLGVAYGRGTFVAVGGVDTLNYSARVVLTSKDGVSWIENSPTGPGSLNRIMFANDFFVATTTRDDVLISPDGVWWIVAYASPTWNGFGYGEPGLTFGKGSLLVSSGTGEILSATTQTNWNRLTSLATPTHGLTFGAGLFLAYGGGWNGSVTLPTQIFSSVNGLEWKAHSYNSLTTLKGGIYARNTFFLVGDSGTILQSGEVLTDLPELRLRFEGKAAHVEWNTVPGYSYQVERSTDLQAWTGANLPNFTGDGTVKSCQITVSSTPMSLYRVAVRESGRSE